MIQSAASEMASEIASGRIDPSRITLKFCEVCLTIQRKVLKDIK